MWWQLVVVKRGTKLHTCTLMLRFTADATSSCSVFATFSCLQLSCACPSAVGSYSDTFTTALLDSCPVDPAGVVMESPPLDVAYCYVKA